MVEPQENNSLDPHVERPLRDTRKLEMQEWRPHWCFGMNGRSAMRRLAEAIPYRSGAA
ncbi:MAG: hypothetical protein OXD46_11675 [Chloroflexi bacterium]|nr:hypothetical protein [Chloroflexota bacterium]